MSRDFEKDLKRSRPEAGPNDLRQKALARAEEEALDPFAASLRGLRPMGPALAFKEQVLASAAREAASAHRDRLVRYAAAAVVAFCVSVNLWVDARPGGDRTPRVPTESVVAGLAAPELDRYLHFTAMIRGQPATGMDWIRIFRARRALAWSEPFSKG